jgi:hypothetical protein
MNLKINITMKNLKDLYPILMNFIELSNYGTKELILNNYTISFLENKSNIEIKDNEIHTDYLFRIFDHHYNDQ